MSSSPSMPYRPDIDGLRAIAVVWVIAFHAGIHGFSGGFIGVDMFFVISGYLITKIINSEIDAGTFSLLTFYERRIRRILPALFAVLGTVFVVGALSFYPPEMRRLAEGILAAILSVANIYYYATVNYFHPGNGMVLLHTWSLAVEEQFYLLFPLLLMWLKRYLPRLAFPVLGGLLLLSFGASVVGVFLWPSATFYLLPARAWELGVGSTLALWPREIRLSIWQRNTISFAGLVLLGGAQLMYDKSQTFPGLRALAPCLGTAFIILAGTGGVPLINRLLSWKPFVFIGLISYSLYLWHMPLIVFLENESITYYVSMPKIAIQMAIVTLTFVLGFLSWRFIEQPFRNKTKWPRKVLFSTASYATAAVLAVTFITMSVSGHIHNLHNSRSMASAEYLNYDAEAGFRSGTCFLMPNHHIADFNDHACLTSDPRKRNILLIGDSFAAHLYSGLHTVLVDDNILQATAARCRPMDTKCAELTAKVFARLASDKSIHTVILARRWSESDAEELEKTLVLLKAKNVRIIVVGSPPTYVLPLPRLLAMSHRDGKELVTKALELNQAQTDKALATVSNRQEATYVSLFSEFCHDGKCNVETEAGNPISYDDGHFTIEGSVLAARKIAAVL